MERKGLRMVSDEGQLRALGFDLHTYHLNEGHSALLTLELLNRWKVRPQDRIAGQPPYGDQQEPRKNVW